MSKEVLTLQFGPEWMKGTPEETREIAETLRSAGVNYMDCWMADPHIRSNMGFAMEEHADEWIVQGHIGSCWVDGQYMRNRDVSLASGLLMISSTTRWTSTRTSIPSRPTGARCAGHAQTSARWEPSPSTRLTRLTGRSAHRAFAA